MFDSTGKIVCAVCAAVTLAMAALSLAWSRLDERSGARAVESAVEKSLAGAAEPRITRVTSTVPAPAPPTLKLAAGPGHLARRAAAPRPRIAVLPSASDDPAACALSAAHAMLGAPYRRGASLPGVGFDCSGLISHVFETAGIALPRTSREQFAVGRAVSRDALSPGDLVFFGTKSGVSHVGIYQGGGEFIHSSRAGGEVSTDNLSEPYFARTYAGARRVDAAGPWPGQVVPAASSLAYDPGQASPLAYAFGPASPHIFTAGQASTMTLASGKTSAGAEHWDSGRGGPSGRIVFDPGTAKAESGRVMKKLAGRF